MELHEEVVGGGAAVHGKAGYAHAGIALHGAHEVAHLVGYGLKGGAHYVAAGGTAGESGYGAAGMGVPVGCPQACEGGHDIYAAVAFHRDGYILAVCGLGDHFEAVPEPLHGRAAGEDGAFQNVAGMVREACAEGGYQPVLACHRLVSRVHEEEASGAVCVLHVSWLQAELAEEGRLLVSRYAADGHARYGASHHLAEKGSGGLHFGEHAARYVEELEKVFIPLQGVYVVQHGAAGVGVVRGV